MARVVVGNAGSNFTSSWPSPDGVNVVGGENADTHDVRVTETSHHRCRRQHAGSTGLTYLHNMIGEHESTRHAHATLAAIARGSMQVLVSLPSQARMPSVHV